MARRNHTNMNYQMLRGVCALMVFFSHALNIFPIPFVEVTAVTPLHIFFDGQCAVMVFFVLSGYFYYNDRQPSIDSYIKGLGRKIRRIYPVHIICIIVGFLLILFLQSRDTSQAHTLMSEWATKFWTQKVSTKEVINNALIVLPHNPDLINPPTWYLFTEVRMFIVMPLIIWAAKRIHISLLYVLLIPSFFCQLPFLQYLFSFLVGASLHRNINNIHIHKTLPLCLTAFAGLILLDINNIYVTDTLPTIVENIILSLQSLGTAMLILVLTKIPSTKTNILTQLGDISYEFYIVHFIVVMSLSLIIPQPAVMIPAALLISIGIAKLLSRI